MPEILSNLVTMCGALTTPSPSIAVAVALVPSFAWDPSKVIIGATVYPEPELVTTTLVIFP